MTNDAVENTSPTTVPLPVSLPPSPARSFRVFHVNDSIDDQVLFQAACRRAGIPFDWHVADSAEKGISYLRTLVEQSAKLPVCWPDLILLDIEMPSVSGFEVLKFIRATAELKHLPVIIFTGQLHRSRLEESLLLGANAVRIKPHTFELTVSLAKELYEMLKGIKGLS